MATSEPLNSPSSTVSLSEVPPSTISPDAPGTSDQTFETDTNKVLFNAVLATNSISLAACLFVITAYFVLRRKNAQVMSRTSLRISVAMVCSDTIYHSANLAGYGNLPRGFICAFVGGWLFATPSFLSTFYACAIAVNTQLVFVHKRIPDCNGKQVYYLVIPPMLAVLISTPTLITGVYGFDEVFGYCWYTTYNVSTRTVLLRIIMTWSLWLSLALVYLIFATILITYSLFSKTGLLSLMVARLPKRSTSHTRSESAEVDTAAMLLVKRDMARRALTVRVLGYISVPVLCVFPGVIIDLLARARPDVHIPAVFPLIAAITASLMGTFNAMLLSFDPSVVAVVFWPRWKKKEQERRQRKSTAAAAARRRGVPEPAALGGCRKAPPLGDIEMAETKDPRDETQGVVVTTIHFRTTDDHGLESNGHSAIPDTIDFEDSGTSTIGYSYRDLIETYHGL